MSYFLVKCVNFLLLTINNGSFLPCPPPPFLRIEKNNFGLHSKDNSLEKGLSMKFAHVRYADERDAISAVDGLRNLTLFGKKLYAFPFMRPNLSADKGKIQTMIWMSFTNFELKGRIESLENPCSQVYRTCQCCYTKFSSGSNRTRDTQLCLQARKCSRF